MIEEGGIFQGIVELEDEKLYFFILLSIGFVYLTHMYHSVLFLLIYEIIIEIDPFSMFVNFK